MVGYRVEELIPMVDANEGLIPVKVRVVIEYTTNLQRDPLAYDGANTEEAIVAREAEYIEDGGDYLFSGEELMIDVAVFRKYGGSSEKLADGRLPAVPRTGDVLYFGTDSFEVVRCIFAVDDTIVDIYVRDIED